MTLPTKRTGIHRRYCLTSEVTIINGVHLFSISCPNSISDSSRSSLNIFLRIFHSLVDSLGSSDSGNTFYVIIWSIFASLETESMCFGSSIQSGVIFLCGSNKHFLRSQVANLCVLHILEGEPADVGISGNVKVESELTLLNEAFSFVCSN